MAPAVLRTVEEVKAWAAGLAREGRRLALVPTMGYLHEGHLSLIREGRRRADVVAVSIFVNPTQFGPREDLSRYPRDFEGDLTKCGEAGADVVFAPTPEVMYPPGYQTYVEVTEVSQGLCGERRPGHFRGVATIVTQLLALFRPAVALFGEKDYQQLQVIKAFNRDLHLGVDIVGMPTVREPDGLAMSSRNAYLSTEERQRALSLSRGLRAALTLLHGGTRDAVALTGAVRHELAAAGLREDYVALVDAERLTPLDVITPGRAARLLVAAFSGNTRLIDNMALGG
ncbi:pantothenate synthetase [Myxococcus fulvus]|jgi:pantoate--beta-alanine ligase|uniref:Pantothenate synthetase n=1 Tax=Myxococcus fulvus TaxID=33 RepID=A0A511TG40_MYXFU|nr:pantoate--beta-alanine ligase [Myxococcus fulvus]GEN12158.1 pantothenate synthetase [Myxococcus fulvus]SEU36377.1 pantothenate synthetase [Myxococcus fulvus]